MHRKSFVLASVFSIAAIALSGAAHAWTLKTLYSFCAQRDCTDGKFPQNGVIRDGAGNLYGVTYEGGDSYDGVLFKLARDPKTGNYTYNRLYSFCKLKLCSDGGGASGDLIIDVAGNVYGTANATGTKCGVVFEFTAGGTYKVLHTFDCSEGSVPIGLSYVRAGIPYDGTSPLYGMTFSGGAYGGGVVYQLTPAKLTWRIKILHNFCAEARCADGKMPWAKLLPVSSRLLYGTTTDGGANNYYGTVFALKNTGGTWSETVLHDFCSEANCLDGESPYGGVFQDRETGDLFGLATMGGTEQIGGVAYRLAKDGSSYEVIHNFCEQDCLDGLGPLGELRRIGDTFFGVTNGNRGNVFQLRYVHGHWVVTSLHTFQSDCSDGCNPNQQRLAMDADGNLFGATSSGGRYGGGTVFELSP